MAGETASNLGGRYRALFTVVGSCFQDRGSGHSIGNAKLHELVWKSTSTSLQVTVRFCCASAGPVISNKAAQIASQHAVPIAGGYRQQPTVGKAPMVVATSRRVRGPTFAATGSGEAQPPPLLVSVRADVDALAAALAADRATVERRRRGLRRIARRVEQRAMAAFVFFHDVLSGKRAANRRSANKPAFARRFDHQK
jgi:hypothetical protein